MNQFAGSPTGFWHVKGTSKTCGPRELVPLTNYSDNIPIWYLTMPYVLYLDNAFNTFAFEIVKTFFSFGTGFSVTYFQKIQPMGVQRDKLT